ncbi:MAG: hypothetical protein Q9187_003500, partial [Circinaria calcarea]
RRTKRSLRMSPKTAPNPPRRYGRRLITFLVVGVGSIIWLLHIWKQIVNTPVPRRPLHSTCSSEPVTKKVAIIGAGSGGTSSAYYIKQFQSPCQRTKIVVYERASYIGGRSTIVNVYNDPSEPVELGASIFVKVNRNLVAAAKEFGLSTDNLGDGRPKESPKTLGVWDGQDFRFIQSQGAYSWWNLAKLLWQYGLAPVRTQRLMKRTVGAFLKLYDEPYFPFRSLSQAAYDLGLTTVTSTRGDVFLDKNQIYPPFTTDIIQASTRVNYAQNLNQIHGLETMVCMATDGAMAVKGGNWQIFRGMLTAAEASLVLNTSVTEILRQENGSYVVHAISERGSRNSQKSLIDQYDAVIIATPLQFSNISFTPIPEHLPERIPYVKLFVTLFASPHKISPGAFNLPPGSPVPEVILTTLPKGQTTLPNDRDRNPPDQAFNSPLGFFSVSILRRVKNHAAMSSRDEFVYKVFSPAALNSTFLSQLLGFPDPKSTLASMPKNDISWLYEKSWDSYPYLPPKVTFDDPQLDANLWYTSGIESFISTMETSSLMGMNVARLIVDDWDAQSDAARKMRNEGVTPSGSLFIE